MIDVHGTVVPLNLCFAYYAKIGILDVYERSNKLAEPQRQAEKARIQYALVDPLISICNPITSKMGRITAIAHASQMMCELR